VKRFQNSFGNSETLMLACFLWRNSVVNDQALRHLSS
jgi:hypothetical protein